MALLTAGTAATNTLRALLVSASMNATDLASFNAAIKGQNAAAMADTTTAYMLNGLLYLPGKRGVIQCIAGDYIMYDPTSGWPIVVTAQAVTGGGFVHS